MLRFARGSKDPKLAKPTVQVRPVLLRFTPQLDTAASSSTMQAINVKKLRARVSNASQVDATAAALAPPADRSWTLNDFTVGRILGTGSFGRVALATHKATSAVCAIKMLSKAHIVKNQQVRTSLWPIQCVKL